MFDQSKGEDSFLPTDRLLHEFATDTCIPRNERMPENFQHLRESLFISAAAECESRMKSCRQTVVSAYAAAFKDMWNGRPISPDRDQILTTFPEVQSALRVSEDESSQAGGGYMYEDTDDLEALLWSDEEESSTGHSPSELTNQEPFSSPSYCHDGCEASFSEKHQIAELEDGEMDSRFCKRQRLEADAAVPDESLSGASLAETPSFESLSDEDQFLRDLQLFLCDSMETADEQNSSGCSHEVSCHSYPKHPASAKKSRRAKIRKTVKLLRNIIPGGDCLDTDIVLDEAIQYVKLLQLKVQSLEAQRIERTR